MQVASLECKTRRPRTRSPLSPLVCGPNSLNFRFGDCFGRNTRTSKAPWGANGEISRHKFYLAFENSIHCNDYISEKFWRNALSSGAVPVVYGLGF